MPPLAEWMPKQHQYMAALLLMCALLAYSPWLDQHADSVLGSAIISTLTLYASVRGVDAVVSSLAGTELLLTPVGIGVTFAPGELLDPVNDLIEQLADVLLWGLALMGVERLGLGLLGSVWVRVGSALLLTGAAALWWWQPQWQWPRVLRKLIFLLVLLRVLLPLTAIASEWIAQQVVQARMENAQTALVTMSQQLSQAQSQAAATNDQVNAAPEDDPSLLERLETVTRTVSESLNIEARIDGLSQRLEAGVQHAIDLLALVILRALLFPALFLISCWLVLRTAED
jgi:hypothetical protein